ncbi:tRNA-specific adenosine deaminase [Thalassobacillus devorans]|uniref:tRNA-specific adenosine deaminase n=1 Tax=Thalassobacillus devorans TaxID=279813 RepID=A0ABQ1NIQ5_9BACI|nr:nucleoside deaminase [Thalassobacillus devorans]NIK27490.1 tRNA(Arg) A34 adenosine deaminase TadA [Thalassobacillus devorans]GGC78147.1 tRNA-specific adenosine deaminase [Thalassobacillus devorans]
MDRFMKRAVDLAVNNVREGGQPFGAVLVKNNQVVAEGVNELHKTYDVSGHAELLSIRRAQEELKTHDLSGFTMYASGEPCPMCLTAMYFAGIEDVYYAASVDQAVQAGLGVYDDLQKQQEERLLMMKHVPLEEGQEDPMKLWKEKTAE